MKWREANELRPLVGLALQRLVPMRIDLAFDSREEESDFVRHRAPQVAQWSVVGHGVVFCINVLTFVWNFLWMRRSSAWDDLDSKAYYYQSRLALLMATCGGIHAVIVAALFIAYYVRLDAARWELTSIVASALVSILLPWVNPWHGIALFGGNPEDIWGPEVKEYEALRILCIVSGVHAYALYVPIRWRFCFIVPLCCITSIVALAFIVGSPYEASIPFKLPLLAFLLLAPALGQRSYEVLVRERWLALQQVSERSNELSGMQAMSGVLCDVTFKLTSALRFIGSDRRRDAFFGEAVEGASILDLMSEGDYERFRRFVDRVTVTHIPGNITLTMAHQRASADVKLFLVELHKSCAADDPKFLVSLLVSREVIDEESIANDAENAIVSMPSIVPELPRFEGLDPIVPHRPTLETISDLSFTYTDSPFGSFAAIPFPIPNNDTKPQLHGTVVSNARASEDATAIACASVIKPPTTHEVSVNTTCVWPQDAAVTHDVAVNTTCVWSQDTFVCSACAKPPMLPGPLPNLRRKAHKQQGNPIERQYEGNEYDGYWILREKDTLAVPDWLRYFDIEGPKVVLGDLTTAILVLGESSAECLLRSGKIWIEDDGILVRKGASGRLSYYDLEASSDSEDEKLSQFGNEVAGDGCGMTS
eukprot:TRINITY_DN11129_c0_g3_i1.p1 TRINITY_DN11129_c0_g3~~TRINITY_DN11129_c0_g3_i1.p1  ORF type:complete len:650 (-),score=61.46 TRINITY_DN11129_c0_g3_i1:230-2179(-)